MFTRSLLKINGIEIDYSRIGEGREQILFLPGGGLAHDYYLGVLEDLATDGDYTIHSFSYPGFGRSGQWEHFSLSNFKQLIDELTANLGLERFIIMGHSLGGGLAAYYSSVSSKPIAMILLCPLLTRMSKNPAKLCLNMFVQIVRERTLPIINGESNKFTLKETVSGMRTMITNPLSVSKLYFFMADPDYKISIPATTVPMLVILAKEDLVVGYSEQQAILEKAANTEVIIVEGGHGIIFSHTADVIKSIQQFSAKLKDNPKN